MEAQTALVRADGTVVLHTITDINVYLTLVVCPRYTEGDDALGFHQTLDELGTLKLGMLVVDILNGD